jgi:phospholipase C
MLNYYVSNGLVKALYRDKNCGTVSTKLGYYSKSEEINWSVKMDGYSMSVTTDKATMTPYVWSWMNTSVPIYFKHGVYV